MWAAGGRVVAFATANGWESAALRREHERTFHELTSCSTYTVRGSSLTRICLPVAANILQPPAYQARYSVVTPSGETICPKYRTSFWNNWHFSGFIFRWDSQSLWNTFRRLSCCSWIVSPTVMSSRYTKQSHLVIQIHSYNRKGHLVT
jgi:hypothetical protein